jgi:hypothetical protein
MKNRVLGLAAAAMLGGFGLKLTQSGAVIRDATVPDIKDLFIPGADYALRFHNGYHGGRGHSGVRAAQRAKRKRKGIAQAKANGCYRSAS